MYNTYVWSELVDKVWNNITSTPSVPIYFEAVWERFHSYKNLATCFTRIWSLMIILLCKVLIVTFWVHHFTHRQEDERYILPQVISHLTKLTNQTSRHNTFILNQPPTPFMIFLGEEFFWDFTHIIISWKDAFSLSPYQQIPFMPSVKKKTWNSFMILV